MPVSDADYSVFYPVISLEKTGGSPRLLIHDDTLNRNPGSIVTILNKKSDLFEELPFRIKWTHIEP